MKIGILTFHSQLNYGGVLQCWALQQALTRMLSEKSKSRVEVEERTDQSTYEARSEKCADEVVVIDRWLDKDNRMLHRGFRPMSLREMSKFSIHSVLGVGDTAWHRRVLRTQRFLEKHINRTPYHFCDWSDLLSSPSTLDFDLIVVGSDQIWHCGDWGDPRIYLFESEKWVGEKSKSEVEVEDRTDQSKSRVEVEEWKLSRCRKISYAASFGMRELPKYLGPEGSSLATVEAEPVYRRGLARFDAISCREQEGVEICRKLGFAATHVVDPTQLLTAADWAPLAKPKRRRQLTCYFLSEDVDAVRPQLEAFARRMHCRVKVLVFDSPRGQDWLPTPNSPRTAKRWLRGIANRIKHRYVRICESAGPIEFVLAHAECELVVTDSFHSLMFATIFGKNVRVLRPKSPDRIKMFARMEEYAAHARGNLISDDLTAALASFERGEISAIDADWLTARREESMKFLITEIGVARK